MKVKSKANPQSVSDLISVSKREFREGSERMGKKKKKKLWRSLEYVVMTVQAIQVYTDVCNLTTVQIPTHFLWLILKMEST